MPGAEHCALGGPGRSTVVLLRLLRPVPRETAPGIPEESGGLVRVVVAGCAAGITVQLGGSILAGAADL